MTCIPSLIVVAVMISPPAPDPVAADRFDGAPIAVPADSSATAEPAASPAEPTVTSPATTLPATTLPAATLPATTHFGGSVPAATVRSVEPVVALYGDSLSWEARHLFAEELATRVPAASVLLHTQGGTAVCDWLDQMRTDAPALAGGVAVVQFSGNNFTPCTLGPWGGPLTGDALVDRYRADVGTAIDVFHSVGATVLLAGAPIVDSELDVMYADLAATHDSVEYGPAGEAVLDDGRWTATLPCLPGEPCDGVIGVAGMPMNVVRDPDGIHFCPTGSAGRGPDDDCPVWSSGAYRYALALAAPVVDLIGPASVPATTAVTQSSCVDDPGGCAIEVGTERTPRPIVRSADSGIGPTTGAMP